ncbi:MAG: hypothetical protein GY809_23255 [Planctomycetes bacterium]|nr:hypothetical protein [Planctomycetota bacterium]
MDIHSKLQSLDLVIIVGYIVTLVAIGMWVSFRRRGAEDLFLSRIVAPTFPKTNIALAALTASGLAEKGTYNVRHFGARGELPSRE